MKIIDRGMEYDSGSGTAEVMIKSHNGMVVCRNLWYTSADAGTIGIYRARQKTTANAADSASVTLVINTDVLGYVGGSVLVAGDFVIVADSSGTGWQRREIDSGGVAGVSDSTVSLTLTAAATCSADDVIFIVRTADIVSLTTAAETVRNEPYVFNGYRNMPVAVLLTATGADKLSIAYNIED